MTVRESVAQPTSVRSVRAALGAAARRNPGGVAVDDGEQRLTFKDLLAAVEQEQHNLDATLPRLPFLLMPPTTVDGVVAVLGAIASSSLALFGDPAWPEQEATAVLGRTGAVAIHRGTTAHPQAMHAKPDSGSRYLGPLIPPDAAFGRFSSGSTGAPRCLLFTEEAFVRAATTWGAAARYGPEDRVLCFATLNNGLAFNASLLSVLAAGATLHLFGGVLTARRMLRRIEESVPTVLVAFPFVYEQLETIGFVPSESLRLGISAAAPISVTARETWIESGRPLCDYYGLVEVGPCTYNDGSHPRTQGLPLPGTSCTVLREDGSPAPTGQTGRVAVETPYQALGYLDDDSPRFADAFGSHGYVTQDLGRMTKAGALVLEGRLGTVVNIAGRKIDPSEVRSVLLEHPRVTDAVVFGDISHRRPMLAACVECHGIDRDDLVRHLQARLADYKIPQLIEVVEQLPRSSAGKPLLSVLNSPRWKASQ